MDILELFSSYTSGDCAVVRPYIIAEAGVNHGCDMALAKRMIDEAKEGGADAIKFQTYRAGTIASKHSPSYWDRTKEPTATQFELFQKYDLWWKDEFSLLEEYCDSVGIEFMSTPFDAESAEFLNGMMKVFKISSSDLTNKPFIRQICGYGKPVILSTGASDLHEVVEAVSWIRDFNVPLSLLHCVLNYPTDDRNANLGMIAALRKHFPEYIIGYSDHTLPKDMRTLEVAMLLGARIIEKHFTFDKTLPGNDHYHAMDKEDLKLFRANCDRVFDLLGSFEVKALPDEAPARRNARRSLVAARDIPAGKVITADDLTWKRPAHGVSPKYIDDILGRVAVKDIAADTVMQWGMVSDDSTGNA